jgi:hypothetical protein
MKIVELSLAMLAGDDTPQVLYGANLSSLPARGSWRGSKQGRTTVPWVLLPRHLRPGRRRRRGPPDDKSETRGVTGNDPRGRERQRRALHARLRCLQQRHRW